jgi:hypothetical protein
MTKAEFLASVREWPWGFPGPEERFPPDWISEAWEIPEVQSEFVGNGFVRDVSKTGCIWHTDEFMRMLAESLTTAQVVRFYTDIRDANTTRESEFRPQFLAWFSRHAHAIPPALTESELAASIGVTVEEMVAYDARLKAERLKVESDPPCDMDDIPF